ncbi:acyltransferase family protein, partial [Bacillus pacificus]|uniref:acyltransferase family protein n=2 Tax=Bacillus TaxID=1386 RepID=UPI002D78F64F
MGTNRVEWIDTAKGVGIFLVILGHTGSLGERMTNYIYSFHMPLFFFLSGYLFSVHKYNNFSVFLKKKFKSLLIPYIIFSLGTYLFWVVVGNKFGEDSNVEIWRPFIGIFYSNGIDNWLVHNVPLWFLTCLFVTESMFYVLSKYIKHTFKIVICLIIFSILGYLDSIYMPIRLPWGIDVALTSIVFFGIGYIVKKNIKPL